MLNIYISFYIFHNMMILIVIVVDENNNLIYFINFTFLLILFSLIKSEYFIKKKIQ